MDDQDQGDGNPPILPHDDDEPTPSPGIFMPQDQDEDEPDESDESAPSASASSDLDDYDFGDQPGATSESPVIVDDDEEEESAEPEGPEGTEPPEGEPAPGPGDDGVACTRECQDQADAQARAIERLRRRIVIRDTEITEKDAVIAELREQLEAAERELAELRPREREQGPSWQEMLRGCLADDRNFSYSTAWRQSYQALNIPIDLNMCHPQIRFIAAQNEDEDEHGSSRQTSPSEASVRSDEGIRAVIPLPDDIIFKILQKLLVFNGCLIHCLSRLDPFSMPTAFPSEQELGSARTGIQNRFFFARDRRSYLSLAHGTEDPNTVLAAACVSKKWSWYSINVFYASNTFAFSSFSELERWCNGIGVARWQRCQNIELVWIGGKCVKFDLPGKKRWNRRTSPLAWFCEAASLRTLALHIRETHRSQIRRPYEPEDRKSYMKGKTAGQPNQRLTRSMRNTMGMDYLYQLRGLYWVHIYDLDRENANPDRSLAKIRDQSFVIDVERVTTQEKVPSRAENSRLENLDPLYPVSRQGWIPRAPDFDRIKALFTEDSGYDNRPNDLDHDATSSQGTLSDSDNSEGEDDSDSSGHSPPGPSRRRRPFTPAPGAGSDDSPDSDSDDDQGQGDSGSGSDDSFEDLSQRRLNQTRSEGGAVSHIDSDLAQHEVEEISSDDEVQEIPAPSSVRPQSRSSAGLFVTPGPGERTTTGTPDTRRRSTSAIQPRRTTSAPRAASSLHIPTSAKVVDLTLEDSDDEGEKDKEDKKEEESTNAGISGRIPPLPTTGTKRRRLTSPPSEVGDPKRRSIERRSLPLDQPWAFPKDL